MLSIPCLNNACYFALCPLYECSMPYALYPFLELRIVPPQVGRLQHCPIPDIIYIYIYMYTYLYTYTYVYLSVSLSLSIYIYIYIHIHIDRYSRLLEIFASPVTSRASHSLDPLPFRRATSQTVRSSVLFCWFLDLR